MRSVLVAALALALAGAGQSRGQAPTLSASYLNADQGVLLAEGVPQPKSLADLRGLQLRAQRGTTSVTAAASIRPALM